MQQALDALAEFHGNQSAAARSLSLDRATFRHRVQAARNAGMEPRPPTEKPRVRVPARSVWSELPPPVSKATRVVVFGCAHDTPSQPDKSRFRWAGQLVRDLMPEFVVDLGDSLDLDSLSGHAAPGSADDRARPAFLAEIASLEEAYGAFDAAAPSADEVPRYRLKGNHENRADRFEAMHPASIGVYTLALSQVFARFNWTERQYREWLYLDGVGFTHAPINGAGREYGGKFAENQILNDATHSIVWSHTHKRNFVQRPKIGVGNAIQVYNTGSMMPFGHIKQYAGLSTTGWTYGVSELTLRDGQIESARYWSLRDLAERYS